MFNPLNILDPLMLTMKLRDSFKAKDSTHVQNYIQDTLANALSRSRNNSSSNASRSVDATQLNEHASRAVSQYLEQMKSMPGMSNYSGLQEYIEGIIRQSLSQSFGNSLGLPPNSAQYNSTKIPDIPQGSRSPKNNEDAEIFEAHNYILVRMPVPQNIHQRNLRVYTSSNRVFIKWNGSNREQIIQLPADVKKDGVKAVIKNCVLELTLPKEQNANSRHVDVEFT